ncbi:nuclease-related domain-containing protein [Scopulibacillus cellulosilyticus]|uniref:Nuclease-related domain-containing protein n=1 Tax=Scopulibacillus cellulosilyticus TaxID=2665665 RepID=A0ABW2PXL5_9BACL
MIHKERNIPLRIVMNKALLRRLPKKHTKRSMIEADLIKRDVGFKGEQNFDFFLSHLPKSNYFILNDLRFPIDDYIVQIDSLILSQSFTLIIEIKHFSGKIILDSINDQFIRVRDGKEERFQNPMSQVFRQRYLLNKWFQQHRFSSVPIEFLVVNSNPFTILQTDPENHHILHAENLLERINKMNDKHLKPIRHTNELMAIVKKLKIDHTPLSVNLLEEYKISYNELLKGVQCPECNHCPMDRNHGIWHCNICNTYSKTAHLQAIDDFLLLVKPSITNSECRDFLLISSRFTANRLLNSANLKGYGDKKNREYRKLF